MRKWIFYNKDFLLPAAFSFDLKKSDVLNHATAWKNLSKINHRTSPKSCNTTFEKAKQHDYHALLKNAFHAPLIIESFQRLLEKGKDPHGRIVHIPGIRKVLGYYTTGIVEKKDKPFVKDSIDFLVLVELEDGSLNCWGGEVKTRTRNATKNQEVAYQRSRFTSQPYTPILSFFDMANAHCNIQNVGERS